MYTEWTWIWLEKWENHENETHIMSDLEYGNKTDKWGKRESHMVGTGIWRETLKNEKNDKCTL